MPSLKTETLSRGSRKFSVVILYIMIIKPHDSSHLSPVYDWKPNYHKGPNTSCDTNTDLRPYDSKTVIFRAILQHFNLTHTTLRLKRHHHKLGSTQAEPSNHSICSRRYPAAPESSVPLQPSLHTSTARFSPGRSQTTTPPARF